MPELPEVEAVVRKLRADATGAQIRAVEVIRARSTHPQSPDTLQAAANRTITSIERKGKNIVLRLSGDYAVRVHLRMTGNLYGIKIITPDVRRGWVRRTCCSGGETDFTPLKWPRRQE